MNFLSFQKKVKIPDAKYKITPILCICSSKGGDPVLFSEDCKFSLALSDR